jgi:hypothetical protein
VAVNTMKAVLYGKKSLHFLHINLKKLFKALETHAHE